MAAQSCQHENHAETVHWGHHQHLKHGADFLDSAMGQDNKEVINHSDHVGHLDHALALVHSVAPTALMPDLASIPQALAPPSYQSVLTSPPKPPRWLPAATGGVAFI